MSQPNGGMPELPQPGSIIGHRQDGRPIYSIAGGSEPSGGGTSGTGGQPAGQQQQQQQPDPAGQQQQQQGGTTSTGEDVTGLKNALAAERTRANAAEKAAGRVTELEAELQKLKDANKTESERALDKVRQETEQATRATLTAEFTQKLVTAEVRAAAGGKLADPEDAVRLLDGAALIKNGEPDRKAIDAAIAKLLQEKPYLAGQAGPPNFDGGQRPGGGDGGDFNSVIRGSRNRG